MKIFFDPKQYNHKPAYELSDGQLLNAFEKPERAEYITAALAKAGFDTPIMPVDRGLETIHKIHSKNYIGFLQTAWGEWIEEHGPEHQALPLVWPTRAMRNSCPQNIDGKLGYYSLDAGSPIMAGTWEAVYASAQTAIAGAEALLLGDRAAFALCRPPGHHATTDTYGGYCFINNAAVAAQCLLDGGKSKVAILDVDYHHGNGTQDIFYNRGDVFFSSLHADPDQEFPYFLGRADETGEKDGLGANLNLPLPWGTDWTHYRAALDQSLTAISTYGAEALIISLGVDVYQGDPISRFQFKTEDFSLMGAMLARLDIPTVFVMEGGYAISEIGDNVAATLNGFI